MTLDTAGLRALVADRRTRTFLMLWLGQTVSLFGSHMTTLALGVWLFRRTGSATPLALTWVAGYLPGIVASPWAGVVVDRFPRKTVLLIADAVQAAATLVAVALIARDALSPWGVYALAAAASLAAAFQQPALEAAIASIVPKEHLGRVNGLQSFGNGLANLAAHPLAGALVLFAGVGAVLAIDAATFALSAALLARLAIPRVATQSTDTPRPPAFVAEIREAWRFLAARPALIGLLRLSTAFTFANMATVVLLTPAVLAQGGDPADLGVVFGAFGAGTLLGGALMTAWGGPHRRALGVCGGIILNGALGQALFGVADGLALWTVASVANGLVLPVLLGSLRALWQESVPAGMQGRAAALRLLAGQAAALAAALAAGPLVDYLLRGAATSTLDLGPGGGYRLVFILSGSLSILIGLAGLIQSSGWQPTPGEAPPSLRGKGAGGLGQSVVSSRPSRDPTTEDGHDHRDIARAARPQPRRPRGLPPQRSPRPLPPPPRPGRVALE